MGEQRLIVRLPINRILHSPGTRQPGPKQGVIRIKWRKTNCKKYGETKRLANPENWFTFGNRKFKENVP